jgi:hypothetical protein
MADSENDRRIVELLEDILAEQRRLTARQADAIEHHRRAIEYQRQATRRASGVLVALIVALTVVILAAYFAPYLAFWLAHR